MENNKGYRPYQLVDGTIVDYYGNIIEEHLNSGFDVWAKSPKQAAFRFAEMYKKQHNKTNMFMKIDEKYIDEIVSINKIKGSN